MKFPIYIKYPDGTAFIKITSADRWQEIRYMGKTKTVKNLEAKIFSDRIYIQDMIQYMIEGKLLQIEEDEYQLQLKDN